MTKPAAFTERRLLDLLAFLVDLHQAGRGDLVERVPYGFDEELPVPGTRGGVVKIRSSQP
jgi:hypothetical protein